MEEYLTVDELSSRIKYSKQSLYNLIYKNIFILGIHYLKPTPKKVLFRWAEVKAWMGEPLCSDDKTAQEEGIQISAPENSVKPTTQNTPKSLINI